jgi:hypothetical protein
LISCSKIFSYLSFTALSASIFSDVLRAAGERRLRVHNTVTDVTIPAPAASPIKGSIQTVRLNPFLVGDERTTSPIQSLSSGYLCLYGFSHGNGHTALTVVAVVEHKPASALADKLV